MKEYALESYFKLTQSPRIPSIGRNPPYVLTFGIFVILCLPAALTPTFGGLLTVRFLLGFFGSPCLATGGASMQDMYPLLKLPYPIAIWSGSAFIAPALGPPLSSFTAQFETFRWTQWEILWLAGPTFLLFMFLPETSADTILLRRAQRLRKITGQQHLLSQSEIKQKHMTARAVAYDALVKPWQINFLDPAVLFSTFYTAVLYAMYYSFFESFPLVYMNIYQFTLGEFGLAFLSIVVALAIIIPCYCAFFYFVVEPKARKEGFGAPEGSLVPAMIGSMVVPVGLFLFGKPSDYLLPVSSVDRKLTRLRSVDKPSFCPLDREYDRCYACRHGLFPHHPEHFHLRSVDLPKIRRITIRRKRLCSERSCRRCDALVWTNVREHRCGSRL